LIEARRGDQRVFTETDSAGHYRLEGLAAGAWHLQVSPRSPADDGALRSLLPEAPSGESIEVAEGTAIEKDWVLPGRR
jgi:hypothetical protein